MKKLILSIYSLIIASTTLFAQEKGPNLILRLDDIGSLRSANAAAGMIPSYQKGTTIEVMAVGPWFMDAVNQIRTHYPNPDIGIHLTLSSEWDNIKWRPLTQCPSLTDKNGYFFPKIYPDSAYQNLSLIENKWNIKEIEQEFRAQIEMVLRNLPNTSHITGHMGAINFDSKVLDMVNRLSEEYGLTHIEDNDAKEKYKVEFVTYDGPRSNVVEKKQSFINMLNKLEAGKNYIFVAHPSLYNFETSTIKHTGYEWVAEDRQGETSILTDPWIEHTMREKKISFTDYGTLTKSLPRSTPEAENVDEQGIKDFLQKLKDRNDDIHSLMVLRNGKVVHEEWFGYHRPQSAHIMYSVTKSFTATAIGFAVAEKKIKVTDKVISFFPDKLPEEVSPYLKSLEIRHLLTMSVGNNPNDMDRNQDDWVKTFLAMPINEKPGTRFSYCNIAPYVLSAIIQKVYGVQLKDFLYARLFRPLGITVDYWGQCKMGINFGGFDLYIRTEDMAKFGQFILNKGAWNGKQLIPTTWFDEATSAQVPCLPSGTKWEDAHTIPEDSDWKQGYGYQMWRCRHNAFRADGAFGQYIIMIPDKNTVVAITANIHDMGNELNMVWEHILPALK
ncbi:MAG: serine hydrolase [Dysgonomonas sp.]